MRLHELASACSLYSARFGVDAALSEFRRATRPRLDITKPHHRKALLVWLNKWGCRHIAIEDHPTASRSLAKWALDYAPTLPGPRARLWNEASDKALNAAAEAYDGLRSARAGLRSRGSKAWPVSLGPTAAAKALYALRRNFFPPWDNAIRKRFGYDGSAESFRAFLVRVQTEIRSLPKEAAAFGIGGERHPGRVGTPRVEPAEADRRVLLGHDQWRIHAAHNVTGVRSSPRHVADDPECPYVRTRRRSHRARRAPTGVARRRNS